MEAKEKGLYRRWRRGCLAGPLQRARQALRPRIAAGAGAPCSVRGPAPGWAYASARGRPRGNRRLGPRGPVLPPLLLYIPQVPSGTPLFITVSFWFSLPFFFKKPRMRRWGSPMTLPPSSQGSASAARGRRWAPLCRPGAAPERGEGGAAWPRPHSALPGLVLRAGRQRGQAVSIPVIDTSSDFKLRKASLIDWAD